MHPQIMQPEPGDCPICGMDLIPAETSAVGLNPNEFKLTKNAMALANIQTSVVGNSENEDATIQLSGKIAENEEQNVIQVSYFSGRIERLFINSTGEKVNKGQLLAEIYSPELFAAQQELITTASIKNTQPELYKAVRNKLKLLKISEKQINQIENTEKIITDFPIYATVSGTVSEKLIAQGATVKQGEAILKIANLNTVWANFDVYENQIDLFKKGQDVVVTTNANPNKKIESKIDFIDPILNKETRTLKLRVVLENKDGFLKPGMFAEASIKKSENNINETLSIPASAVLWTGKRSVVYLKTAKVEPVFEMQQITLGNKIGDYYQVLEGLFNGNEIVTNGTFTIDAAAQLQGKKSMMNRNKTSNITNHKGHLGIEKEKIIFEPSIQKSFKTVIKAYLNLKDAFVTSDVSKIANESISFRKSLDLISISEREKTHNYWFLLHKTSKMIHENTSLENQREAFKTLSEKMIEMMTNFDDLDETYFVQFCPMANDNKGAYWLSKEENVINPYYGEAMLTCGEVKQIIK